MIDKPRERWAKGTFLIALAMIINHRKDLDWLGQTSLTERDMEQIRGKILPSSWYSLDLFERMGSAVFKLVGKEKPEGAYEFGNGIMWQILKKVYSNSLLRNNPGSALSIFATLYNGIFFNTGEAHFEKDESGGTFRITDIFGIPSQESFVPMLKSLLRKIVEENQGRDVRVECPEESVLRSKKLNSATYRIYWR
jgi:hypothetical protein